MKYARKFLLIFDFGLLVATRPNQSGWLQDVADILVDVRNDLLRKSNFLGMGWRPNGFFITTAHESGEDFYFICTQACGVASQFLALGLPIRGCLCLGELVDELQNGAHVCFGPAASEANRLVDENRLPRVLIAPGIPISRLGKTIRLDEDEAKYLDIFDEGFLHDYWALHYRYENVDNLPIPQLPPVINLLSQLRDEAVSSNKAIFSWLLSFLTDTPPQR